MAWRVSTSPVQERAKALGIRNPRQLQQRAGIDYRTAYRWWHDDQTITRLETEVLLLLADALKCEPGELIKRVPKE